MTGANRWGLAPQSGDRAYAGHMSPRVVSLHRYPVKSMGGEPLAVAHFTSRGVSGDRIFAVRDADERLASSRDTDNLVRRDGVFDFDARTEGRRVVIADAAGRIGDAGTPPVNAALTSVLGVEVRIAQETDIPHIDNGAVSIIGTATLDWCARELGGDPDPQRLRINIVVETTEPFEEEEWIGSILTIGGVQLRAKGRIERSPTIDLAKRGSEAPAPWLEVLQRRREGRLGVYCDVVSRGAVAARDELTVEAPGSP